MDADYGWKLMHLRTGVVTWVNEDDVRTNVITRRQFYDRFEDVPTTHTLEKIGRDGEVHYGPVDI